jgi:SAM-dependent methyltransferase
MFDAVQDLVLARFKPDENFEAAYAGTSKLRTLLGDDIVAGLSGCIVADFGCGYGAECAELARVAAHVYGIDIEPRARDAARQRNADNANVTIVETLETPVDAVISLDAFEHFADPAAMLALMARHLKPGGRIYASFGPTWFHPLGGHLFSVFPWAHLVFSERALIRWRSRYRHDGATTFAETEGGLNRMTIRRFEQIAAASGLMIERLEAVPIRRLAALHNRLTREYTTAIVRATLRKPV